MADTVDDNPVMTLHIDLDDFLSEKWRTAAADQILGAGCTRSTIDKVIRLAARETLINFMVKNGYAVLREDGYWLEVTKHGASALFK